MNTYKVIMAVPTLVRIAAESTQDAHNEATRMAWAETVEGFQAKVYSIELESSDEE